MAAYLISFFSGLAVSLSVTLMTGKKEAWDSGVYFTIGIPVMAVVILLVAYSYPTRVWRWTLAMAFGQSVAMILAGSSLTLWPLGMIAMTICSLPQFAAGAVGARLRIRKQP